MMLGYPAARAPACATVVLEKHADFLRDFRGDTVHPSTLRIMDELGLLDAFLQRPHQRLRALIGGWFGDERVQLGDFSGLPERYAFIAMMPQWEFLDFLVGEARKLPAFDAADAGRRDRARDRRRWPRRRRARPRARGRFEIRADCTIGCDGRHSTVRAAAGLAVEDLGAPIDVLWFRVGAIRRRGLGSLARIAPGHFVVTIDRGDYWQCAFVIPKGGAEALQRTADRGLPRAGRRRPRRCSRRTSATSALVGRRQAAHRRRRPAARTGRSPGCSASATRRMRCRRSAASASTWRSRTRSPPPTCSPRSCATARRHRRRPRRGRGGAVSGRPRRRRRCRSRSRTTCSCG